jgi:uncharacterized protein YndB with AHSA1/START domain
MNNQTLEKTNAAQSHPQRTTSMAPARVIHSTFVIEKTYPKPAARVFAAFADPATKRRWYAERDTHTIERFEMDFRAGGSEVLHYRFGAGTPFPGAVIVNENHFLDIVPDSRIVMASSMAFGEKRFSASLLTFEFLENAKGCDLICTHQGAFFENSDGPEMREKGWQDLLAALDREIGD